MVNCIASELIYHSRRFNQPIHSIYFGGGTPSVLKSNEIDHLLSTLHDNFEVGENPEITFEANPEDLTDSYLKELRSLGFTRLSLGVQTLNDGLLDSINRNHTSTQAVRSIELSRKHGFDNINLDLIYSLPGSNMEILQNDVGRLIEMDPEHISLYAFTVEPKTVFENWIRKGKLKTIEEEEEALQFEYIMKALREAGYEQYEISNYAKEGKYSFHNSSYWNLTPYLGVGPSAHSFDGARRWMNKGTNFEYIQSIEKGAPPISYEARTHSDLANEYIFTSLRTQWGCDLVKLKEMGGNLDVQTLDGLKNQQLVIENKGKLLLTQKGRLLADQIASDLFIENE